MTKSQLQNLKRIKNIIRSIQKEIDELPTVGDTVKGSSIGSPWTSHTIVIEGKSPKAWLGLRRRLNSRLDELQEEISDIEDWLITLEPEEEEIARLKYINGLTHDEIAGELGICSRTVDRKVGCLHKNLDDY